MQFVPYLYFSGQCETAFKFYEQLFGGKIESVGFHAFGKPFQNAHQKQT